MQFLFVHQNFPGQYGQLCRYLAKQGHRVVALGDKKNMGQRVRQLASQIQLFAYDLPALAPTNDPFDAAVRSAIHRGRAVAAAASQLRSKGFAPDLIFAHLGWGEAVFLKDVFPKAKLLLYCEFFYRAHGSDVGFDPEFQPQRDVALRLRVKNTPLLMALEASDHGVSPTRWQQQQFPMPNRSRIAVVHDGIDTDLVRENPQAQFRVPGTSVVLSAHDQVISYVARNLEPYRGFHTLMRAIPKIQQRCPNASIVVVGGDKVSYSPSLPPGDTYRERLLRELAGQIDLSRVHFTGILPYADYLSLLQVSSAHVYLTYPFVLSWSLLEAMSAGCLVIASRTLPVEEVITHGDNGLLFDFFSTAQLVDQIEEALGSPPGKRSRSIRERARSTVVERFDLRRVCLPGHTSLIARLLGTADGVVAVDSDAKSLLHRDTVTKVEGVRRRELPQLGEVRHAKRF